MPIISEEKRAANRANAARSTGPRSAAGKLAARFNALRHGLTARQAVLPGEDHQEWLALSHELIARFRPVGRFERALVDRIALEAWRLRRAGLAETACLGMLTAACEVEFAADGRPEGADEMAAIAAAFGDPEGGALVERLARYETRIERSLEKAMKLLERARAARSEHMPAFRAPSEPEAEREPTEAELLEEARRNLERSDREEREVLEAQRERRRRLYGDRADEVTDENEARFAAAFGFVSPDPRPPGVT